MFIPLIALVVVIIAVVWYMIFNAKRKDKGNIRRPDDR
jgi:cbb3-type cytochrome oxidase subunit 3